MDVGRPARVRHRANGPERVSTIAGYGRAAKTLKGAVTLPEPIARMAVKPVSVALPNLNDSAFDRPPATIKDSAADVSDDALRARRLPADYDEVIITVGGPIDGILRALGLTRGRRTSNGRLCPNNCRGRHQSYRRDAATDELPAGPHFSCAFFRLPISLPFSLCHLRLSRILI